MKAFVVATNANYAAITLAETQEDAIQKVALFYFDEYDEDRDDWTAYDLEDYLEPDEVMEIKDFYA